MTTSMLEQRGMTQAYIDKIKPIAVVQTAYQYWLANAPTCPCNKKPKYSIGIVDSGGTEILEIGKSYDLSSTGYKVDSAVGFINPLPTGDFTVRSQFDVTNNGGHSVSASIALPDLRIGIHAIISIEIHSFLSDEPQEVGCFLPPSSYDSSHTGLTDLSHGECIIKCHDDGHRVAALLNVIIIKVPEISTYLFQLKLLFQGVDCHCLNDIGTDSVLLDQVASSRCNAVCPGNNKQKCGGTGVLTVVVAECEAGWTRFGGKCFKEVTRTDPIDWRDAMQTCAQVAYFSIVFLSILATIIPGTRKLPVVSIITSGIPICD